MTPIAPPVPADLDLTNFPFMPLDVRRLRDSDLALDSDPEVFKAAVLLWCASWHQVPASSLPNCDRKLAKLAGYGDNLKRWSKVKTEALRGFSVATDGRLYHVVVAEKAGEAHAAKLRSAHKREVERLKKAAQRAEQKPVLPTFEVWLANFQETGDEHWTPPPSTPSVPGVSLGTGSGQEDGHPGGRDGEIDKDKDKGQGQGSNKGIGPAAGDPPASGSSSKRGSRLAPDWVLPKVWGTWALERGMPEARIRNEAEKFRNHWVSKPGKDGLKLDWEATWRNWVLRSLDEGPAPAGGPKAPLRAGDIGAIHDHNLAATEEARRLRPDLFPNS